MKLLTKQKKGGKIDMRPNLIAFMKMYTLGKVYLFALHKSFS